MAAPGRRDTGEPIAYSRVHQQMLERYAPPSVLVGPDEKIVHYSEHAGRYLVHPGGGPTTSVFKLVREELRVELRSALRAALERGRATSTKAVTVRFDGVAAPVVLHVWPVDPVEMLTDRQLEVFRLIGEGGDARSIAERLHLSVHTVETHRENIKRKLDVEKLSDLNRRAVLWTQENR